MSGASREFTDAIRDTVRDVLETEGRGPLHAVVTDAASLAASALDSDLRFSGDDLVLGQWAARYDNDVGIETGDMLVLHQLTDGDFLVLEVLSPARQARAAGAGRAARVGSRAREHRRAGRARLGTGTSTR